MATMMSGLGFQDLIGSQSNTMNMNPTRKISKGETIHSGHFMISEIEENSHLAQTEPNEPTHESDYEHQDEPTNQIYDLTSECRETTQTYVYGPMFSNVVSIDGSLTKLFECMTLAYSGKITSPRWKTFKGLRLRLKDKIRLNNIIWRAWHIQYIAGRKPIVCQFYSPVDGDMHKKPESVVLEGKYWKRRLASVTAEYQKWRMYYRKIGRPETPSRPSSFDWENRWSNWSATNSVSDYTCDDYSMDFNDTLFTNLLQSNLIDFPNPREIARSGMGAEFMQPGLVQLQPNLDFMDTFEPLQEFFFNSKNVSSLPTLPEETSIENQSNNLIDSENSKICHSIPEGSTQSDILNSLLCQTTTTTASTPNTLTSMDTYSAINISDMKQISEPIGQTQQLNSDMNLQFKNDNMQAIQPIQQIQDLQQMSGMNIMSEKPMQGPVFTQFRPSLGAQRDVPLQQSQSSVQSVIIPKTRASISYNFAQNNTAFSHYNVNDVTQTCATKSSPIKQKYINLGSPEAMSTSEKFAVPKSVPLKQRSRARSISSPHINKDNNASQSFTVMPPQAAISLTDINSNRLNANVERSTSLPVYTHERKRSVPAMSLNMSNTNLSSNILYSPKHQKHIIGQTNAEQVSYPSQQIVVTNPYNLSTGSSSGSTLIARLLASNSLNNISNITQQIYSNNQSAAPNVEMSNNQNMRSTTIDASCIGIRSPVGVNNDRPHYVLSPDFKDRNLSTISGHMQQNLKQNFVLQSSPDLSSSASQTSQISSPIQSRSSPVGSLKDFIGMSSVASSPPSLSSHLKVIKTKRGEDRTQYKEHRRVCHINAEQKRRCNIKNGFDTLRTLLPSVSHTSNTKISKAAMLNKAAEHIRALKNDRQQQLEELELLKKQADSLNQTIGVFQNQLPATGVPISSQRSSQTRELYENYVKTRTLQNWKFWIFSKIMESLLESYNSTVATSNVDEMCKTLLRWLDQNCCLITLRRDVLNSLRFLSTSTSILTDPSSLPEEAVMAVTKKEKQSSS